MKKLIYLIALILVLGLIVPGCLPVVPPAEQDELGNQTKGDVTFTVKLLDSKENGLAGGLAQYFHHTTQWQTIGTTDSDGTVSAVLQVKPSQIKMTYEWVTNWSKQDISDNPVVTFSTIDVPVTLKTCKGDGLGGGVAEYLSGYWRPIGTTDVNGEIHKEMLPANLQFKMTYAYGTDRFYQDTASAPSVDFKTTKVTLNYNGTIEYQSGYWRPFTSPMEMMPGTYLFKFTNGSGVVILRENFVIAGCETTINLLTSNQPPVVNSVAANPGQLWPPNGKPVSVIITVDATDPNGPEDIVRTTYSVTDEYGTYNVAETDLPEDGVISLIAERDGKDKDGRVYTIIVTVYDAGGLSDSGSVDVVVPHDQGNRL